MSDTKNETTTCQALLAAESEAAVEKIVLDPTGVFARGTWEPLDGRETNFNVTSNQASDGGKALTELMTNMVDAVLMKHVRQAGVDPKDENAPQTMYAAVDRHVKDVHGGKITALDPQKDPWLREFAQENLVIGITGSRTAKEGFPCYTFADNGEGQHPDSFRRTFLSLSEGNKKDIPFVQGKYNMGSSGVLRYCGRRWYKLILSCRHDHPGTWGWTLVRRRPTDVDAMPVAEYFVLPDDDSNTPNRDKTIIPRFDTPEVFPFHTASGARYTNMRLVSGTVVKLYDYLVGTHFVSFKGAREALNENLVETILPFRIMDFRQEPTTKAGRERARRRGGDRALGIDSRPFYGMEFLLRHSYREDEFDEEEEMPMGERTMSVANIIDPALGEISISAIPLKGLPSWLKPGQSNNRVFHAVNGQVQFKQTRGYVSQVCKLPTLMDRAVIIVDASNLSFAAHNEVWKGDREHISNTLQGEAYKKKVTEAIMNSQALKELQRQIADQELARITESEDGTLFRKLVETDPNIGQFLAGHDPDMRVPSGKTPAPADVPDLRFHPTFVRFHAKVVRGGVDIPHNKRRGVSALTDAQNDYFVRDNTPGKLLLSSDIREKFSIVRYLFDGRLVISLEPDPEKTGVGETMRLAVSLKDDGMASPVESEEVEIRITGPEDPSPPKDRKKPRPNPEGNASSMVELPKYVLLTKNGRDIPGYTTEKWPDDFGPTEGGLVEDLGERGLVYKINYDNAYHINCRNQQKGRAAREAVTKKYILGMLISMLGMEHALEKILAMGKDESQLAYSVDEFRKLAARGAASTVITIAESLPRIIGKSLASQDDE